MFDDNFSAILFATLEVMAVLFVVDVTQTRHAIRRNFPVVGRFRSLFEHLGEFFRQYFFAMDREELPFNRAQRSWVYRAGDNIDATVAFGSTRDLRRTGTVLFVNCPFPTLDEDTVATQPITLGPYCARPYVTDALLNISAMSYGAISRPAVQASARGFMFALGCIQALKCNQNTCPTGITTHNLKLQRGLDPADKAVRVMNYAKSIVWEVGIIAHSCGVKEPRQLLRFHARIVSPDGSSTPLDVLHPDVPDRIKAAIQPKAKPL